MSIEREESGGVNYFEKGEHRDRRRCDYYLIG